MLHPATFYPSTPSSAISVPNLGVVFCRGIRIPLFASKLVSERMQAIADMIAGADYDIVVLEEVSFSRQCLVTSMFPLCVYLVK